MGNFYTDSCLYFLLQTSEYIPLHEKDNREIPYLPLVGNITTITSFFFLCLLGPATGLLYDIWVSFRKPYCFRQILFIIFQILFYDVKCF